VGKQPPVTDGSIVVRSEVLMAVKMSMLVFWVITQCELVGSYQHFRGTYCLQCNCWEVDTLYRVRRTRLAMATANGRFSELSIHLRQSHHHVHRTLHQWLLYPLSTPPSTALAGWCPNTISRWSTSYQENHLASIRPLTLWSRSVSTCTICFNNQ
jgi:hypothetical protein